MNNSYRQSKEIASLIGIGGSTLRKWCFAPEKENINFEKGSMIKGFSLKKI